MTKIIKVENCGACINSEFKHNSGRELIDCCSELPENENIIYNHTKILPNCPLEDYPEIDENETRPANTKLEFYQCEKCKCLYQFFEDSQNEKSCPNCLSSKFIVKFKPETGERTKLALDLMKSNLYEE